MKIQGKAGKWKKENTYLFTKVIKGEILNAGYFLKIS